MTHHSHHKPPPSLPELKRRYAFVMMLNRREHCPEKFERAQGKRRQTTRSRRRDRTG